MNAERDEIRSLANSFAENANGHVDDESFNYIGLTVNGITVELHSIPGFMANFVYNRRLQRWLKQNVDEQCNNMVALPNDAGLVAVPTHSFNVVYQLYHLYHHYFYEGVGLRQVVDYYFVLVKSEELIVKNSIALEREFKHLGLWKFAGAMMFVLYKVMGMPKDKMIAPMDAKRGQMLLDDILNGGTYGSKTFKVTGTAVIPGTEEAATGYISLANNDEMVYLFIQRNGKARMVGSEAFSPELTLSQDLGKAATDTNSTTVQAVASDEYPAPFYPGKIETEDGDISGATGLPIVVAA